MTACVVSTPPPNAREEQQGKNKKKNHTLGTSWYHKKLKAFRPSWPSRGKSAGKMAAHSVGIVQNHQSNTRQDQHLGTGLGRSATIKTIKKLKRNLLIWVTFNSLMMTPDGTSVGAETSNHNPTSRLGSDYLNSII